VSALDTLLAALVGAPALPGARCRGRHHLFDQAARGENPDTVNTRHAQALGLCARCPSLSRCKDWFNALPARERPFGVVAGRVNQPPARPKPTEANAAS
jgi:WhiB family redox-sensing transcriptional regulator